MKGKDQMNIIKTIINKLKSMLLKSESFFSNHSFLVTFSEENNRGEWIETQCLYVRKNMLSVLKSIKLDERKKNKRIISIEDYDYRNIEGKRIRIENKSMTKERWFWQNDDKLTGKEDLDTIIYKLKKLEDEYIK